MHSTEYTWIDDFYEDIPETVFCDFYRVQLGVGVKGTYFTLVFSEIYFKQKACITLIIAAEVAHLSRRPRSLGSFSPGFVHSSYHLLVLCPGTSILCACVSRRGAPGTHFGLVH